MQTRPQFCFNLGKTCYNTVFQRSLRACIPVKGVKRMCRILAFVPFLVYLVFVFISPASAQLRPWDSSNDVLVDFSVLDGYRNSGRLGFTNFQSYKPSFKNGLIDAPLKRPVSRLIGETDSASKLPPISLIAPPGKKLAKPAVKKKKIKPALKQKRSKPAVAKKPVAVKKIKLIGKNKQQSNVTSASKVGGTKDNDIQATPKLPKVASLPSLGSAPAGKPAAEHKSKKKKIDDNSVKKVAIPTRNPKPSVPESIVFTQGEAKLTIASKKKLDLVSENLKSEKNTRMQLLAYAGGKNMSSSNARRLSLSRALSIRSYLIDKGVEGTRIDVRALGNKETTGQINRVDLKFVER